MTRGRVVKTTDFEFQLEISGRNEINHSLGKVVEQVWRNCVKQPLISEKVEIKRKSGEKLRKNIVSCGKRKEKNRMACERRHASFTPLVTSFDEMLGK